MHENVFLPEYLVQYGDVALLKTLREYERTYVQLSTRATPAFDRVRCQIGEAIHAIEEELCKRGRMGAVLAPASRIGEC